MNPVTVEKEPQVKEGIYAKAKKNYGIYNKYKGLAGIMLNYDLGDLKAKEPELKENFE